MKLLVTGRAGFTGSALVRLLINEPNATAINVDKLRYAEHLESLNGVLDSPLYLKAMQDAPPPGYGNGAQCAWQALCLMLMPEH